LFQVGVTPPQHPWVRRNRVRQPCYLTLLQATDRTVYNTARAKNFWLVVTNPLRNTPAGKQAEVFHMTFSLARTPFSGSRSECVDRVLTQPGRCCGATPRALFDFESGVTRSRVSVGAVDSARSALLGGHQFDSNYRFSSIFPPPLFSVSCVAHGSWLMAHGSWLMAHGSWLMAHGSWLMAHGSWLMAHGSWLMVR
jgi:hypothetical protein